MEGRKRLLRWVLYCPVSLAAVCLFPSATLWPAFSAFVGRMEGRTGGGMFGLLTGVLLWLDGAGAGWIFFAALVGWLSGGEGTPRWPGMMARAGLALLAVELVHLTAALIHGWRSFLALLAAAGVDFARALVISGAVCPVFGLIDRKWGVLR